MEPMEKREATVEMCIRDSKQCELTDEEVDQLLRTELLPQ